MISAVVITKNEEQMITACLESLKWVDEIIIYDNGSSDKTLEIAKKFTNKIYHFKGQDYAALRNLSFEKSTRDWILYVDADERVLLPLREEIQKLMLDTKFNAFAISRRNIILGHEVSYGPFWPDRMIRLVRRTAFSKWVGTIHEHMEFKGELGYTQNSLLHLTHRNVDQIVLKSLNWSNFDAKLRLDSRHPKMTTWRFLRILFGELVYQGIIRRGFFSGTVGTIDSLLQTFSLVLTYIRLWQLQQPVDLDQKYRQIDTELAQNDFKLS